jgi:hypothetical protein
VIGEHDANDTIVASEIRTSCGQVSWKTTPRYKSLTKQLTPPQRKRLDYMAGRRVLGELTDTDFDRLGASIGHRRKLLKALAAGVPEADAAPPSSPIAARLTPGPKPLGRLRLERTENR